MPMHPAPYSSPAPLGGYKICLNNIKQKAIHQSGLYNLLLLLFFDTHNTQMNTMGYTKPGMRFDFPHLLIGLLII